jgi:V8-like Glu-specific endopeptidase/uncharacterized protein YycO
MPVIRANREAIDDRFSVLGFTIRTESPLYEVGIAADPALFRSENRARRNKRNFYSSRVNGALRARRGEAVYLVPPEVLSNFVGQPKLYFGLATYTEGNRSRPDFVQSPSEGNMYVNLVALTERGLRRTNAKVNNGSAYGNVNNVADVSLEWGGDALSGGSSPAPAATSPSVNTNLATPENSAAVAAGLDYDDGYSSKLWKSPVPVAHAQDVLLHPFYRSNNTTQALRDQSGFLAGSVAWFVGVEDTTAFPHSAICQVRTADTDEEIGSAFYIGPNLLLTAAHVVSGSSSLTFVPGKNGASSEPFGRFTVASSQWRSHESYTGANHNFDFAIIKTPNAAPHGQYFSLEELRQSTVEGVVVCGYSMESRGRDLIHRLINRTIDTNKQHLHGGHIRVLQDETFEYDIQTLMGASGSPVYQVLGSGDQLYVSCVGIHVGGASDDTNLGCRITDAKIAWITSTANALGVSLAFGEAPVSLRSSNTNKQGGAIVSRASDYERPNFNALNDVDLKLRVFIPSPAIYVERPVLSDHVFSGDGRSFQYDGGTSRAELHARLSFDPSTNRPSLNVIDQHWGESKEYRIEDSVTVSGKPSWYRNIREGAHHIDQATLGRTASNLSAGLNNAGGREGMISNIEGSNHVKFHVEGGLPLLTMTFDIDANLSVHVRRSGDRMQARVHGSHDGFPAYEIYANQTRLYSYDPLVSGADPTALFGTGHWDQEIDTSYVDIGPATQWRLIPVHANARAISQAQEIPLDPGAGGQSIDVSALQVGDIIVSTARHPVSYIIRGGTVSSISHAMIYVGNGNVVEAVGSGVREVPLVTAINDAILAVAYRHSSISASQAQTAAGFARAQVGRPYNYTGAAGVTNRILHPILSRVGDAIANRMGFHRDEARSFYCSELVFAAFEHAGVPLVASSAGSSTPSDIVDLSRNVVAYVGHLKAEDTPFGIPLSLPMSNTLGGSSFALYWDDVPYLPQSSAMSCWAASAAMVIGWRDRVSISDQSIADMVPAFNAYVSGLFANQRPDLANAWNLVPEPPASYTIDAWRNMLESYGPLWIDGLSSPAGGGHVRVMVGLESDGNADGSGTTVYLYDPSPSSAGRVKMSFSQFLQLYEGRTTNVGGFLQMQILHAASAAGRATTSAAPFAMAQSLKQVQQRRQQNNALIPAHAASYSKSLASMDSDHAVHLIPQTDKNSCWAAAMAMLLSFRRNASYEPETLANEVGRSLMTSYGWDMLAAVRDRYGFQTIDVPSNSSLYFQPQQWAEWLNTFGPLWVVIVGMPHAVVLAGIRGDLDQPDSVEVHVLNPWDTRVAFDNDPVAFNPANNGYSDWLSFNRFAKDFGAMAESDYGRWRVLHLPTRGATSQGLSSAMSQNVSRRAPPPRPLTVDSGSTALREPIEPSRVIGTTMHRVRGQSGRVTYMLEQLEGFKSTDTSPAILAPIIPQQIVLDAWPRLNQDSAPLPLILRFASDGSRVGDIRIEPASTDASALPYDVDINAMILDGNNSSSTVAAINVRIDYLYRASDGEHRACTELTLYGNGRNAMNSSWK